VQVRDRFKPIDAHQMAKRLLKAQPLENRPGLGCGSDCKAVSAPHRDRSQPSPRIPMAAQQFLEDFTRVCDEDWG
jgi:hypothetical protein